MTIRLGRGTSGRRRCWPNIRVTDKVRPSAISYSYRVVILEFGAVIDMSSHARTVLVNLRILKVLMLPRVQRQNPIIVASY